MSGKNGIIHLIIHLMSDESLPFAPERLLESVWQAVFACLVIRTVRPRGGLDKNFRHNLAYSRQRTHSSCAAHPALCLIRRLVPSTYSDLARPQQLRTVFANSVLGVCPSCTYS